MRVVIYPFQGYLEKCLRSGSSLKSDAPGIEANEGAAGSVSLGDCGAYLETQDGGFSFFFFLP
jgi:hypothetical protein